MTSSCPISRLVAERGVEEIVIGESKNNAGQDNSVQKAIKELVGVPTLELGLPVHLEPEQFTSQAAARVTGRTSNTDAGAAALILDSFIVNTIHHERHHCLRRLR